MVTTWEGGWNAAGSSELGPGMVLDILQDILAANKDLPPIPVVLRQKPAGGALVIVSDS